MRNRIFAIGGVGSAFFVSLAGFLLPASGVAADTCHSILANKFYGEYSRLGLPQRDRALYAELCSLDYSKAESIMKRAQSSDRLMGLRYGLINLDEVDPEVEPNGKASPAPAVNGLRFSQWQSGYCSQYSAEPSSQAAELFMQRAAKGNAELAKSVEAWSACMRKQEGLSCWASPSGSRADEVLLNVNWTKGAAQPQQPEVRYSYLNRGGISKFKGAEARRILPDGYRLSAGTLQVPITRPDDKGVFATLTVNQGNKEQSCKVFLPDEKDFPLLEPFVNRLKLRYPG
ncbi:MAG TPA: hypothetical protein VHB01_04655 [Nitrosospira sp.]|nr:hypothetical protein [Nitrosospira sp.]